MKFDSKFPLKVDPILLARSIVYEDGFVKFEEESFDSKENRKRDFVEGKNRFGGRIPRVPFSMENNRFVEYFLREMRERSRERYVGTLSR